MPTTRLPAGYACDKGADGDTVPPPASLTVNASCASFEKTSARSPRAKPHDPPAGHPGAVTSIASGAPGPAIPARSAVCDRVSGTYSDADPVGVVRQLRIRAGRRCAPEGSARRNRSTVHVEGPAPAASRSWRSASVATRSRCCRSATSDWTVTAPCAAMANCTSTPASAPTMAAEIEHLDEHVACSVPAALCASRGKGRGLFAAAVPGSTQHFAGRGGRRNAATRWNNLVSWSSGQDAHEA